MSFLDFIKNRNQAVSAPANEQSGPSPDSAKQMQTREAAQDKANTPAVSSLPAAELAKAREIGDIIKNVRTEPAPTPTPAAPSSAPAPSGGTDNQQPMRQPSMALSNGAPDLSPTSAQMGMKEAELPVRPSPTPPSQSPTKPPRSISYDR